MSQTDNKPEMKFAVAMALRPAQPETADELARSIRAQLGTASVDLCVLFASAHFEDEIEVLAEKLHDLLSPRAFAGCTAEAVIAGEHEFERQPGLVLWAGSLPGAQCRSFHFSHEDSKRLDSAAAVIEHVGVSPDDEPSFLLIGDPFTIYPPEFLERLALAYPGRPAVGGMASAADKPKQNALIFDGQVLRHGLVGIALTGDVRMHPIVSQGCRPIGRHLVVTRADKNVIFSLGGKPTMDALHEVLQELPQHDRKLLDHGLLVGCVVNEYQQNFSRGDFLIRNPVGIDPDTRALAISDFVRTGQTVQFHVRDGQSADEDLALLLERAAAAIRPRAALLFTCNGRGMSLFNYRHHDARAVTDAFAAPPLAGLFCAGEIGPVGARNYLHGFTAAVALFTPAVQ